MIKKFIFVLYLALVCGQLRNETESPVTDSTTTETIMTAQVTIELNVTSSASPAIVNFVQLNNKLIDTQNTSENGRLIKPVCGANCGLSLTLVVVLVCVISAVIGVILTALFVMRRRFSIWRLNGKSEEGGVEQVDGKIEKIENGEEKDANVSTNGLTRVENKEASIENCVTVNVDNGHSNQAADLNKQDVQTEDNKQQASPSSSSPLIDNNDESAKLINEAPLNGNATQTDPVTSTSTSSLIVNVLNELSESVASKLSSKSPSASKLTSKADSEKPLLNNQ